jgi:DinB superfamily
MGDRETREALRSELNATRDAFQALLASMSEENLAKKSKNLGWTNGEVFFHMTFAFMILPALVLMLRIWGRLPKRFSKLFARFLNSMTVPFNAINALGARSGGRFHKRERLSRRFDRAIGSLLKLLDSTEDDDWSRGMYYPTRWEGLFDDYMTLEKLIHYPTTHFEFHRGQISR